MRILVAELRQIFCHRFVWLCLLGAVILSALFPCMNLRDLDRTVDQLFSTPGILYGLLLVMAVMAVPLGRDFTERTFQQKIAQGEQRMLLTSAKYVTSLLWAAMVVTVFPLSTIHFTRIYSGWHTAQGQNFAYLLSDSRFHACLLAYGIGVLAAGSLCFLIAALCRDLPKSLGFSTGYVVLLVMLSQKSQDLDSLSFLRPVLKWTPLYQLLVSIRQATIAPKDLQFLLLTSCVLITGVAVISCLVLLRASLK